MTLGSPSPRRSGLAAALVLALAALLLTAACSPQRAVEAKRLLADVAARDGPSALKERTEAPKRQEIRYQIEGRPGLADLYTPAEGAEAALVVVPGLTPAGKDDARLVPFVTSLARTRFEVLVPDIANFRQQRVMAEDARPVADAVRHLSERGRDDSPRPVGLVAISYAAGPALLAALEPETGRRVAFIGLIGGYHDMEAVTTFFTTGYFRGAGEADWRYREPNVYGKWFFVESNAPRLTDQRDRTLLTEMARRKRADPADDVAELVARLGPEGRSVHALLENQDPERVPGLIAKLPAAIREPLAALDLKRRDLSRLRAQVILIHGRDDPIIPSTESEALARALPASRTRLYIVDNLGHVALGPGGLGDIFRLWEAAYRVLQERDRMTAGGEN